MHVIYMNVLIIALININLQLSTWAETLQPQLLRVERNGAQVSLVKVEPRGTQPIQPVVVQPIQPLAGQPLWSQPAAPVLLSSSTISPVAIVPLWQQPVTLSLPPSNATCAVQTLHPHTAYNTHHKAAIDACVQLCCADRPGTCTCVCGCVRQSQLCSV
jgi:hypothetical protein